MAPMLWQVRVIGGRYYCRSSNVSQELAAKYLHGEESSHEVVRSDFVNVGEPHEFAGIEAAHDWFATDWDVQSQAYADYLLSLIAPDKFTHSLVSIDEAKELLAARGESLG